MKKVSLLSFGMAVMIFLPSTLSAVGIQQTDSSIGSFWSRFRSAVMRADKAAVADLTRFPVEMPYGMARVRNRTQLISRYRTVFNGESDASKCFKTAQPQTDPANAKLFTVGCKNAAGDEVVIYSFAKTATGWKFSGLDNLNE